MTYIKGQNKIIAIENDEQIKISVIRNKKTGDIEKVMVNDKASIFIESLVEKGKPLEIIAQMLFTNKRIEENYRKPSFAHSTGSHLSNSDGVIFG